MAETSGAQFLRLRRKCKEGIDLARGEQVKRSGLMVGTGDPVYVFCGVETDFQSHQPQQIGRDYLQADGFAFQTGDAADVVPSEQLDTPHMHTGEHCLPAKLSERRDLKLCKIQPEIDLGLCQCATDYVRHVQWDLDISNVGKALGPQQVCRRHQRRLADHAIIDEAHRRRFESVLGGQRSRRADQSGSTGQREGGQKAASGLYQRHRKPRIRWLHVLAMLSF